MRASGDRIASETCQPDPNGRPGSNEMVDGCARSGALTFTIPAVIRLPSSPFARVRISPPPPTPSPPRMPPSLHISAGPSVDKLQPLAVNHDESPLEIESEGFRGRATVRIKSFTGHDPPGVEHQRDAPYFDDKHRRGITWSIQLQGRFKREISTDDAVFGNAFDKPIRDNLPYGTSVALQFVRVVDPNMKHDLYADQPWAFSPFIASMTHINVQRLGKGVELDGGASEETALQGYPAWPTPATEDGRTSAVSKDGYIVDSTGALVTHEGDEGGGNGEGENSSNARARVSDTHASLMDETTFLGLSWPADDNGSDREALNARKKLFGDAKKRAKINFTPRDVFTADFCLGEQRCVCVCVRWGGHSGVARCARVGEHRRRKLVLRVVSADSRTRRYSPRVRARAPRMTSSPANVAPPPFWYSAI